LVALAACVRRTVRGAAPNGGRAPGPTPFVQALVLRTAQGGLSKRERNGRQPTTRAPGTTRAGA